MVTPREVPRSTLINSLVLSLSCHKLNSLIIVRLHSAIYFQLIYVWKSAFYLLYGIYYDACLNYAKCFILIILRNAKGFYTIERFMYK